MDSKRCASFNYQIFIKVILTDLDFHKICVLNLPKFILNICSSWIMSIALLFDFWIYQMKCRLYRSLTINHKNLSNILNCFSFHSFISIYRLNIQKETLQCCISYSCNLMWICGSSNCYN